VVRISVFLSLAATLVAPLSAQRGTLDPAFEGIPFDQWFSEQDQAHFRWTVKVPHAELSFHQRLASSIDIKLDGQDLESRRSHGKLGLLIQIKDVEGTRYQEHGSIELSKLDPDVKAANIDYSQRAFFVPGDYQLAVAIVDPATGEHSASQLQFKVPAPAHGWLTDAWRDLPAVEYIGNDVSPESWYLPNIRGRLPWAAAVHSPARLNVILNVAPSRRGSSDLGALLPSLKVISHSGSSAVSEHVALLDISRRRSVFDQDEVHELDWPRLKASLGEANTASIDLHSLADRHEDAQFFVSQVRRLLRASADKPCVLVVLTKPVSFDSGEDREPISLEALPPCHVFYLRYHAPQVRSFGPQMGGMGRRSRMGGGPGGGPMMSNQTQQENFDQLESTLKPLSPKVIDVETPQQVTKALTEIEKSLEVTAEGPPDRDTSRR
jgi:hypothetical protein